MKGEWWQIDVVKPKAIVGVKTQGRKGGSNNQRVTSYKVCLGTCFDVRSGLCLGMCVHVQLGVCFRLGSCLCVRLYTYFNACFTFIRPYAPGED